MVNHDPKALSWDIDPLGISGIFNGEVLVNYANILDPMGMYEVYGFSSDTGNIYSLPISMSHPSMGSISVARNMVERTAYKSSWMPKTRCLQRQMDFSYLPLVDDKYPDLPGQFFCEQMLLMGMDIRNSARLFDNIIQANRKSFLELLDSIEKISGEVPENLAGMVKLQLNKLNL